MTKLIVGLGNPTKKHSENRHNIGFMVIDKLIRGHKNCETIKTDNYILSKYGDLLFLKPLTYMNTSGNAVKQVIDKFDITLDNILVVYDDISLPLGKIRVKTNSSAGGHNGVKSIIESISKNFARLKLGVNPPPENVELIDYVLSDFDINELTELNKVIDLAQEICINWVHNDINNVMNKYNGM